MAPPEPVLPVDAGPVTPVDVVLTGVEEGVAPVVLAEAGSLGAVAPVPSPLDVEVGFAGKAAAAGSVGPATLGGVPGPSRVVSWLGSSVGVIDSGEDRSCDRACRRLGPADDVLEVSGFEAAVLEALPAALAAADE